MNKMFVKYIGFGFILFFIIFGILKLTNTVEYSAVDSSICNNSDDCLINLAIEEGNPNYCEDVSAYKSTCYASVAMKNYDYDLCDKVGDEYASRTCKITISYDSKDMSSCLKYSYEDKTENLMAGKPTKQLCESAIKQKYVEVDDESGSLIGMMMKKDVEECEKISENPYIQNETIMKEAVESCYYEVAITTENISLCEKTQVPRKYYCLARVGALM